MSEVHAVTAAELRRERLMDGAHLRRRKAAETRFRLYGMAAVIVGIGFLAILFATIIGNGYT
ncbi:MAG TPA: DUF3333 domain-containing protein, partial [Alphaproteobacteria bacterium]|nr:DUF3333 domain-containing protein [Alphaproteobacteria bacterium]